jgi:ankyrin repeat protein
MREYNETLTNELCNAIIGREADKAISIIKKGAEINDRDNNKWTPLHYAAYYNITEVVLELIDKKAYINAVNNIGLTPLHYACKHGNTKAAIALIENGADIKMKDAYDLTPLHWAVKHDNSEIVEAFTKKGVDLNVRDRWGRSPLASAISNGDDINAMYLLNQGAIYYDGHNELDGQPMCAAIMHRRHKLAEKMQYICFEKGLYVYDVDTARNRGPRGFLYFIAFLLTLITLMVLGGTHVIPVGLYLGLTLPLIFSPLYRMIWPDSIHKYRLGTPLHRAILSEDNKLALDLIENNSSLNKKDKLYSPPIHLAIQKRNTKIALALLEKGVDINATNKYGETPLHAAILHENNELALKLIEKGADFGIKDEYGKTPFDLAKATDNAKVINAINNANDMGNDFKHNTSRTVFLVSSIITSMASPTLLIMGFALPALSIILFGCAAVTAVSSIITLNSYFKAPEYLPMPKGMNMHQGSSNIPTNANMITTVAATAPSISEQPKENKKELSSSQNNNLPQ